MKPRYEIFLFLLLFTLLLEANAQANQPRIAVIPLNHINVSKSDAEAITGLFETALVKTEIFDVIEQGQVNEILETQEYSMSDYTDEQSAVEFGKLLAAEQIVLGSVSKIGSLYVINTRLIDVQTGRNIKADKVDASTIEELAGQVDLLAFKLAGLTYQKGQQISIAREFVEIFIETAPAGADVYINGIKKGVSPDLISRVPIGEIKIEARKGIYYGEKIVEVSESTKEVKIILSEMFGNLLIKSSEQDVIVYFDNKLLGELGSGYFKELPIGVHRIELKGDGLYWEGEVEIKTGEGAKVDAFPGAFGQITYSLPEGTTAEINGKMFSKKIKDSGNLDLIWSGSYTITVSGEIYEPYTDTVKIEKGRIAIFKPRLSFTREYEYEIFNRNLKEAEKYLVEGYRVTDNHINEVEKVKEEINSSKHSFIELVSRANYLIERIRIKKDEHDKKEHLESLFVQKEEIESQIRRNNKTRKVKKLAGWISLGIGVLSAGFSGYSYLMSDTAYNNYIDTNITSEAENYRKDVEMWDTLMFVGAGGCGGGLTLSAVLFLTGPNNKKGALELDRIEREIKRLGVR